MIGEFHEFPQCVFWYKNDENYCDDFSSSEVMFNNICLSGAVQYYSFPLKKSQI